MSDHKTALKVRAELTEKPRPVADLVRETGMAPKTVRESLMWLEKHDRATIHFGKGWSL